MSYGRRMGTGHSEVGSHSHESGNPYKLTALVWILAPYVGMTYKLGVILVAILLTFSTKAVAMDISSVVQILGSRKIHVVAPASSISQEKLLELPRIKRLNIKMPMDCFDSSSPYMAASDERRFKCLKEAIYDDSTDVIWCLRGGYGSSRLIEELRNLPKPKKEKLFIGYSDITALHLFFSQEWGWHPIHGTVLKEFLQDDKDISGMKRLAGLIAGRNKTATINDLVPMNTAAKKSTEIKGKVTGGNLTTVQTGLGTNWAIQSSGKILFFEDTGMKPYQTYRALAHLGQAGVFKDVKAIIFGAFDNDSEDTIRGLEIFATEVNIPVFKTNRFGHAKYNDPVIYNAPSTIAISSKAGYFNLIMHFGG